MTTDEKVYLIVTEMAGEGRSIKEISGVLDARGFRRKCDKRYGPVIIRRLLDPSRRKKCECGCESYFSDLSPTSDRRFNNNSCRTKTKKTLENYVTVTKICECPCKQEFEDKTVGHIRKYANGGKCRTRMLKGNGWNPASALRKKSNPSDAPWRRSLCAKPNISRQENCGLICRYYPDMLDAAIQHKKCPNYKDGIDCWQAPDEPRINLTGPSFAKATDYNFA